MDRLYFSDQEFGNVRDTYTAKVDKIEEDLRVYIDHTKSIVLEKNLQGRAADALLDFIETVEANIKDELADILSRHKAITGQFIEKLETQDETRF